MKILKKLRGRVEGSAMIYALFLFIVVSVVIAGLFEMSMLNRKLAIKFEIEEILVNNSKSGIVYAQAYFFELEPNRKTTIRLFDDGIDSVEILRKNWGAYQIIQSKAIHNHQSYSKIVLVGSKNKKEYPNLYLADQGRPLSLCGKTKIEGSCLLPKSGVKRAYIANESYQGSKLIYGTKGESNKQLPKINNDLILQLNLTQGEKIPWDNTLEKFNCPFDSIPVHFFSNDPIYIEYQSFSGQIIIESTDSVIISANADLRDVIIRSPKIIIEKGFRGNIQCLATQKIEVQEDVILEYPSVLGLVEYQQNETPSFIEIKSNVQIIGSIFLISEVPNFRKPIRLKIDKGSVVNGFVYCAGETELKGRINGSIYTQKFYLKTASSAYQNHLLNAEILNQLPDNFIAIPLLEESNQIKIIQWLK